MGDVVSVDYKWLNSAPKRGRIRVPTGDGPLRRESGIAERVDFNTERAENVEMGKRSAYSNWAQQAVPLQILLTARPL